MKPRAGTQVERYADGGVVVRVDGSYAWPGISIAPAEDGTWDLSNAGVVEVAVSNGCDRTEMIHATVLGRGFGLDKSPARSALMPPHGVRTISVQIADEFCVTDEPVKMDGMKGRVRAKSELLDFSATTSVDVYQTLGDSHRKAEFAVLDVRTAFAARHPAVIAATNFFPFVDKYGQFKHGEWKGKIHSDEELQRVRAREEKWLAEHAEGPVADADQYGGWLKGPLLKATGFFRTEKVDGKWWLVDPAGHVFFSLGIDCVYPSNSTVIDGCAETFDQQERARCFTRYVNDCLDSPRYVGCHWFQYQDQPLTGRPDGENYNDGFVSACDFPYSELVDACRKTAAQIYQRRCK